MSKRETIAICFCGAAKTTALGIPLVAALFGSASNLKQSAIEIPVVLYTTEQVFFAQIFVYGFKWWLRRGLDKERDPEAGESITDRETEAQGGIEESGRDGATNATDKETAPIGAREPEPAMEGLPRGEGEVI